MTKEQRKELMKNLGDMVTAAMLNKLDDIPERWEELEFRQYICDKAKQFNPFKMTRKRMWNYEDDVKDRGL